MNSSIWDLKNYFLKLLYLLNVLVKSINLGNHLSLIKSHIYKIPSSEQLINYFVFEGFHMI